MALSTIPALYGPIITNRDYEFLIADDTFFKPLIALDGHSLGAPDVDSSDPVSVPRMFRERGRLIQRMVYVKPMIIRTRSYEIGFPTGAFWTPLLKLTSSVSGCRRTAFARYICPTKPCFEHFFEYPEALFDPVVEQEAIIATDDDEAGIAATATMHTTQRLQYNHLRVNEVYDNSAAVPNENIRGVLFALANCESCSETDRHGTAYIFGDDGAVTPAGLLKKLTNNLTTQTSLAAAAISAGMTSDDIVAGYADGDFAIFIANDATDTEILVTSDGGTSFTLGKNTATGNPIFLATILKAVTRGLGYYWAVGTAGDIYRSQDAVNWTIVTLPATFATHVFNAVSVDHTNGFMYVVGATAGGAALVVRTDGEGWSDITTTVFNGAGPAATAMNAVRVLADDHIIIGGASGRIQEGINASSSPTWAQQISNTTGAILWFGGNAYRTLYITTTSVKERSAITDMAFEEVEKVAGVSYNENLTGMDTGETFYGANNFIVVSLAEVFKLIDCLPDS